MASKLPRYTLRIDKLLLEKIKFIAESEGRSANKEIERLIKKHVDDYESSNGTINIEIK